MPSKFALIIANTEYTDPGLAQLTAPGRDAKEFGRVLDSPELGAFDDVIVLLNENESKVSEAIDYFFSQKKPDDLLLLYFSGHGVRDEYGSLYLAVKNTNRARLRSTAIKSDFIREAMDESRSRRQILILDCCNSGAFAQGTKAEAGGSVGTAKAFEGTGYGRVVLTASDSTQFAWEGDKVIGEETSNSLFTHFLVKGLKGEADQDGDGKITVDELYDYAYEQIVSLTPKQTPGKWSYKQQGEIILCDNLKPRDVKPAPLPSDLLELLSHPNSGVRRAAIQDLISLLDGKHLGLARAAQDKLREIAENDDSLSLRKSASDTLVAHGLFIEPRAPLEIPKEEKKTDATEKKPELEILASQAIQYELKGDFWNALQTYYQIKRLDPLFPRVDIKIQELERELRPKPTQGEIKPVPVPKQKVGIASFNLRLIGFVAGALFVIILFVWGGGVLLSNKNRPSSTQTSIPPNPAFDIGSTLTGKDGMTLFYVPAGEFTMGSDSGNDDEKPVHTVTLDAFWIDKSEVTNAMFAEFLNQEGNQNEGGVTWLDAGDDHVRIHLDGSAWKADAGYENHPVVEVSWYGANAYCFWVNRRLPTEAEWEKAARGENANTYPWGNDEPNDNDNLLNYNGLVGDTTGVGAYPDGASVYGALDMAGNVWEWVDDWYGAYPGNTISNSDYGTTYRVLRGGSWNYDESGVRSANRNWVDPRDASYYVVGFRCALSADGQTGSTPLAQVATQTSQPEITNTPSPTQTSIASAPTLGIGSTLTGKDGMTLLYVPAGEFTMGSDNGHADERPAHQVYLDAFWIDQTEVTVGMYYLCMLSDCDYPLSALSPVHGYYFYDNSEYENYPVIYVDWYMAKTYCEWAGRRLPTEAEWEKSARGDDLRVYPWGNDIPTNNLLNFTSTVKDTTVVGNYSNGASPYGALDMAGNVSEWVADWYSEIYYASLREYTNPLGPDSGNSRVLRGGSWASPKYEISSSARQRSYPGYSYKYVGFRCAMSATP